MRFAFPVKHNGVLYEAGKEVPIGKEPKVENQVEDKTASELSKELEEKYGIKMAPQKGKKALLEALSEAEVKAGELSKEEDEEEELEELEEPEDDGETGEANEDELEEDSNPEDNEDDLLNKIINE